jgi:predicted nucleotidyltransferase
MSAIGLSTREIALMEGVFRRFPAIQGVVLYGSRAKGTHSPQSDIDLSLIGVEKALEAEAVALELDELPLPYRFDVRAFGSIRNARLRAHIEQVGIPLYRREEAKVAAV